jgi:hypothetical protein
MVTRRRPRHYRDGGVVVPTSPADVADVAPAAVGRKAPPEAAPEILPAAAPDMIPPATPEASDAVMAALVAQKRAEAMASGGQAAPAPQPQPAAPQMSERRRQFIEANPELRDPRNDEAIRGYLGQAKRMNITDEADIDNFVLSGLRWEAATRAPRREEPEPAPSRAQSPLPRSMPEQRRSMPMAAPVTREVPTYSGKPRTSGTLSAEEREAAIAAIPDRPDLPKLSARQKEMMYLEQREKYRRMVADGTYSEQRQR